MNTLKTLSPTHDDYGKIQGEIQRLNSINTDLEKEKKALTERKSRLDGFITSAETKFKEMQKGRSIAETAKTIAKMKLDVDKTIIYTDEKSAQYILEVPGGDFNKDWDPNRVKYNSPLSPNEPETNNSNATNKTTVTPILKKEPEVSPIDKTLNTVKVNVDKGELLKAIQGLNQKAQDALLANPTLFWHESIRQNTMQGKTIAYGPQTLKKLQTDKDRINALYE